MSRTDRVSKPEPRAEAARSRRAPFAAGIPLVIRCPAPPGQPPDVPRATPRNPDRRATNSRNSFSSISLRVESGVHQHHGLDKRTAPGQPGSAQLYECAALGRRELRTGTNARLSGSQVLGTAHWYQWAALGFWEQRNRWSAPPEAYGPSSRMRPQLRGATARARRSRSPPATSRGRPAEA